MLLFTFFCFTTLLIRNKKHNNNNNNNNNNNTVKPVISGHPIKWTPSIKGTVATVPNLFPLFALNETFIKRTPLLSGRRHLKST